jgi:hypothetical protein
LNRDYKGQKVESQIEKEKRPVLRKESF